MNSSVCQQARHKVAPAVTSARQMRHFGGVIQSTNPCHSANARVRPRWLRAGISAIGSSVMEGPHHIFDRAVHVARVAAATGEAATALDRHIGNELAERLAVINRSFAETVLLASRPTASREILVEAGKCLKINLLQPFPDDRLSLPEASCDCLISLLDLQTVNDVPGHLAQVARTLRPDGLALFAFFAGETLKELREAWLAAETELSGGVTPRVAPMIDLREAGGLLQRAGLALPVADMERLTLRYDNALALMAEIKALGFANPMVGRSRRFTPRRLLQRVAEVYQQRFADEDGRIRLTLDIAWAMAWKPHPSQQQPLKPGSAKIRLADALRVTKDV
jgi:SAM-dependent methyltransferase